MSKLIVLIAVCVSSSCTFASVLWNDRPSMIAHEICTDGRLTVYFSHNLAVAIIDGKSEDEEDDWRNFFEEDLRQCLVDSSNGGIKRIELRNIPSDYADDIITAVCNIANNLTPHPSLLLHNVDLSVTSRQKLADLQRDKKLDVYVVTPAPALPRRDAAARETSSDLPISVVMEDSIRNFTLLIEGTAGTQSIPEEKLQNQIEAAVGQCYIQETAFQWEHGARVFDNILYNIRVRNISSTLMSNVIAAFDESVLKTSHFAIVNW
ncbi:MAG: hypothetical protein K6C34_00005, partial [Alphaproteobacteria bacterium]|nr:hypothetical protein [Alphaproteobacteria bacterium]